MLDLAQGFLIVKIGLTELTAMARVSNRIEILFSVCKMLSFLAATLIVTSNLITRTLCGPLDWAKVEVPWARADRSKQHLVTHITHYANLFRTFFFSLQFPST